MFKEDTTERLKVKKWNAHVIESIYYYTSNLANRKMQKELFRKKIRLK
jgi:hypothetical protein